MLTISNNLNRIDRIELYKIKNISKLFQSLELWKSYNLIIKN